MEKWDELESILTDNELKNSMTVFKNKKTEKRTLRWQLIKQLQNEH